MLLVLDSLAHRAAFCGVPDSLDPEQNSLRGHLVRRTVTDLSDDTLQAFAHR